MQFLPRLCALLLLTFAVGACKKDKDDPQPATSDSPGEVKYTYAGVTYTVTDVREVSAFLSTGSNNMLIMASPDGKPGISLALNNFTTTGTRLLQRGSTSDLRSTVAQLTRFDSPAPNKPAYSTLYGPSATNGSVVVTSYNLSGNRLTGTFSFTGGPISGSGATGTAVVTNGSFDFTVINRF